MMANRFFRRPLRLALAVALVGALSAISAGTSSAQAVQFTDNEFIPFTLTAEGCGDVIEISGTLHVLIHVTFDDAGGVTVKQHFQPQGATGVGLVSGATYQATGVTQETDTDNGPGPQFEFTFVNNFKIISQGTTPNFLVHDTVHVTVNNNGEITAEVTNSSVECRG
jgi:hypothetical protein